MSEQLTEPQQGTSPEMPQNTNTNILFGLWSQFKDLAYSFLGERFSIIDVAEPESTIAGIKKDVDFRGFALWILIFSIFIASIGLNVNSTAVVIGAMLISPLMGPIMGIGLSIGIYDFSLLWRSLKNLGVAVGIALITSALYFFVSPISAPSNELFARTNPTLLDVLVALFGGLAGILAGSRKEKSNVIPGVAIATALMPPLCTAGYGLANGEWNYFFGALYLFLINSVLIAAATTVVVRYLKFPHVDIPDPVQEKKISRYFTIAISVVIIPSIWIFYRTVTNTIQQTRVEQFVTETIVFPGAEIVKEEISFEGGKPVVDLVLFGELVPDNLLEKWQKDFSASNEGTLNIVQGKDDSNGLLEMSKLVNLYSEGRAEAKGYQDRIAELEGQLNLLENQLIPANLAKEVQVNYPEVTSMSLGTLQGGISSEHSGTRIPVAFVLWDPALNDSTKAVRTQQLSHWLQLRLEADSVLVR